MCASYADTLIAVKAALDEQGIPIKHFLLDSWWYGEGWNKGAALWEDTPTCTGNDTSATPAAYPADTFPLGLAKFRDTVGAGMAIWAHNGLWTSDSPYRQTYPFASGEAEGPPQGRELWDHLFKVNREWGLSTIKQDHVRQQVDATRSAYTNVSVLKNWMQGMGEGAASNNVSVLYCCAEPNIHMNGVTVPAAYAVRSSPDYVWGAGSAAIQLPTVQWAIGPDAAFHWNGLGLLPYKDTFISNVTSSQRSGRSWTSDESNWPSFSGYHETNAATHALMALLSMAHVTFSDAVGETNKTLVMQLIRSDGMLLKPDRPATAIDAQFQAMLFGSWPGQHEGPGGAGSLFTMPCDQHDAMQRFVYTCTHGPYRCIVELAPNATNSTGAKTGAGSAGANTAGGGRGRGYGHGKGKGKGDGCLAVISGCNSSSEGAPQPTAEVGAKVALVDNAGGLACGEATTGGCGVRGQWWQLTRNEHAPRGGGQVAIRSGLNTSKGEPLCVQLGDGGAKLQVCDTGVAPQGWLVNSKAQQGGPFSFYTTEHDDTNCLTAAADLAGGVPSRGAFAFESGEDAARLADEIFPRTRPGDAHQLTDQYRSAYTTSAGLMRSIQERQAAQRKQQRRRQQCGKSGGGGGGGGGGLGAPQGPLGEVYSTHATVGGSTWRYVVGVQLAADYNVTRHDLALGNDPSTGTGEYVSYRYDASAPGFRPPSTEDLVAAAAGRVLTLKAGTEEMCKTAPDFGVTTRCFPFELFAVAPVASNGWVLTGETGKFIPVSNQRLASVDALPRSAGGGFSVSIKGEPGESVEIGAADTHAGGLVAYAKVVVGADGTATLTVGTK